MMMISVVIIYGEKDFTVRYHRYDNCNDSGCNKWRMFGRRESFALTKGAVRLFAEFKWPAHERGGLTRVYLRAINEGKGKYPG